MSWPTPADVRLLAGASGGPCVSLYVPLRTAFSQHAGNAQRYGHAVARVADRLGAEGVPVGQIGGWVERLTHLERDLRRPGKPPLGIGVFLDRGLTQAFKLAAPPDPRVVVADCFALRELVQQVELVWNPDGERNEAPPDPGKLALSLDRILVAACRDGVRRFWAREGATIPGRIDPATGRIVSAQGGDGDVLDALAVRVLRGGGEVRVVGTEHMPGPGSAAAELY